MVNLLIDSGACAFAVTGADEVDAGEMRRYHEWLDAGCNGTMDYLGRHDEVRANPALLLEGARSMVVCAFSYLHHERPNVDGLRIAHYAQGEDYHAVIRRQLTPLATALEADGHACRVCVDTAPLRERYWARRAGLGFTGRNGMLIIPGIGSMFFLGTLLTTAALDPVTGHIIRPDGTLQAIGRDTLDRAAAACLGCGACLRACPAQALKGDGTMDARRCLNYLTIEYKGELPPGTSPGRRLYGCDECQLACPHNRMVTPGMIRHPAGDPFAQRAALVGLRRADIAAMGAGAYRRLTRGSAMARATAAMLRRNLAAIGNSEPECHSTDGIKNQP